MNEKNIIKKLKNAGRQGFSLPLNSAVIKYALLQKIQEKQVAFLKFAPVYVLLIFMIITAAISIYIKVDYNNNSDNKNELGGIWCTYDDSYYGGISRVWPPASKKGENSFVKSEPGFNGRGYAIRITGVAGAKLGWDFIGVNTFLSPRSMCPECSGIDLTRFKGIKFKIKGKVEAGQVKFVIPYEARIIDKNRGVCKSLTSYGDYEADITGKIFSDWKEVKINFRKDLKQPSWISQEKRVNIEKVLSDAKVIKWEYSRGQGHYIDLWIDDIEFY